MVKRIQVAGFKSIREADVELGALTVLIGANGSGKSNFLSVFELLHAIYAAKLRRSVALQGGVDRVLHLGRKQTTELSLQVELNGVLSGYEVLLEAGTDGFVVSREIAEFAKDRTTHTYVSGGAEAQVGSSTIGPYDKARLTAFDFERYHFHDTGRNSPFNKPSRTTVDLRRLATDGGNLAGFLYGMHTRGDAQYALLRDVLRSVLPYFFDFHFDLSSEGWVSLNWHHRYSEDLFSVSDFSDGSIRFIALCALFLQPSLPPTIVIDEPELGLHPAALRKLFGLFESAIARGAQIIAATQSTDLVDLCQPEQIVTVDTVGGSSEIKRLKTDELQTWLDSYSLGDLWSQRIIREGQVQS